MGPDGRLELGIARRITFPQWVSVWGSKPISGRAFLLRGALELRCSRLQRAPLEVVRHRPLFLGSFLYQATLEVRCNTKI